MKTRREFLVKGGQVYMGLATLPLVACTDSGGSGSSGPVRKYTLSCDMLDTRIDDTRVQLRAYNGQIPGPLIEVNPGDQLDIELVNNLPHYDSSEWTGDHNVPHHLGSTNLHVHGLQVIPHLFEPVGTSNPDAPMIEIPHGETKRYSFAIPDDQPGGFYWYHPHKHGSTAVQAVTGMAGPIIVRGPIDEVPEIAAARDLQIVINDIGLFPAEGQVEGEEALWNYMPKQNAVWNTTKSVVEVWNPDTKSMEEDPTLQSGFTAGDYRLRYYLVNGTPVCREDHNEMQPQSPVSTQLDEVPEFRVKSGEVVRFRLLNACSDLLAPIHVEGHEIQLIALDGINFGAPRRMTTKDQSFDETTSPALRPLVTTYSEDATTLVIAPANRAEFLIRGEAPGVYDIVQLETKGLQFLEASRKVLARIVVEGASETVMNFPTELPLPPRENSLFESGVSVAQTRSIRFGMNFLNDVDNEIVGIDFMINEDLYDMMRIDQRARLGDVDEWVVSVGTNLNGMEGHPFHIHTNSFELYSIGGEVQPKGTVMDTVWVGKDSQVIFRTQYKQWVGKAVYHCHIFPHEDTGMMQNILIEA